MAATFTRSSNSRDKSGRRRYRRESFVLAEANAVSLNSLQQSEMSKCIRRLKLLRSDARPRTRFEQLRVDHSARSANRSDCEASVLTPPSPQHDLSAV